VVSSCNHPPLLEFFASDFLPLVATAANLAHETIEAQRGRPAALTTAHDAQDVRRGYFELTAAPRKPPSHETDPYLTCALAPFDCGAQ